MFLFDYDDVASAARERIDTYQKDAKKKRKEQADDTESWQHIQKDRQQREILQSVKLGEMGVNEGLLRLKRL